MDQEHQPEASPRVRFTRNLQRHRKRQAEIVAAGLINELDLVGLTPTNKRSLYLSREAELFLREPHMMELSRLLHLVTSVNKVVKPRTSNRKVVLHLIASHEESGWRQVFQFCDVCEPIPYGLTESAKARGVEGVRARGELSTLSKALERCEKAGQQRRVIMLHSHRISELATRIEERLFRKQGGIVFSKTDAVGPRLKDNLRKVIRPDEPWSDAPFGELFKVHFTAKVPLHLRVAAVDDNGAVIVEYGEAGESDGEGGESDSDPARRELAFVGVGSLVAAASLGSPPDGHLLSAGG